MLYLLRRAVRRFILMFVRATLHTAHRRRVLAIPVYVERADELAPDACFSKVSEALSLIARYDPARFARMRRDLRRILVDGNRVSRGQYVSEFTLCRLDDAYVASEQTSAAELALTIVHEAAHAKVDRAGISYSPDRQIRIERVCVAAEIAFARKLPNAKTLAAEARNRCVHAEAWWSPLALRHHRIEALKQLGAPMWFVRLFAWATRRQTHTA